MGLSKKIELKNGIITNYHRIASVNVITNQQNIIEIASYTSKEKREIEKEAIEKGETFDVFVEATYVASPYDPDMTVISAYDYLKTLPEFKNATDIIEEEVTKDD